MGINSWHVYSNILLTLETISVLWNNSDRFRRTSIHFFQCLDIFVTLALLSRTKSEFTGLFKSVFTQERRFGRTCTTYRHMTSGTFLVTSGTDPFFFKSAPDVYINQPTSCACVKRARKRWFSFQLFDNQFPQAFVCLKGHSWPEVHCSSSWYCHKKDITCIGHRLFFEVLSW